MRLEKKEGSERTENGQVALERDASMRFINPLISKARHSRATIGDFITTKNLVLSLLGPNGPWAPLRCPGYHECISSYFVSSGRALTGAESTLR